MTRSSLKTIALRNSIGQRSGRLILIEIKRNKKINMNQMNTLFLALIFFIACDEDNPKSIVSQHQPTGYNLNIESIYYPFERYNRTVRVLVPSDYSESEKAYPVIYMHDGQNLFNDATAYASEWGVDETLEKINKVHGLQFIVVGIDNAGSERFNEYSPWANLQYGNSKGVEYAKFVVNSIKPFIDSQYRTKPSAENTYMFGSSMGGFISHYFMLKYSDVIANYGIFSPSYWYSESIFTETQKLSQISDVKIYMYMGAQEGPIMTSNFERMDHILNDKVVSNNSNYKNVLNPEGKHTESFWRQEFEKAILWLAL